jgi:hypothetical protein
MPACILFTGILPVHRKSLFDDLVLEDGETLYTGPPPQPKATTEEKTSDTDTPMATLPAGIRRRYPEDEVGMTIWQHDLAAAASRRHKREQDCTTMWGLLFAAMNKTVQTKVIINLNSSKSEKLEQNSPALVTSAFFLLLGGFEPITEKTVDLLSGLLDH